MDGVLALRNDIAREAERHVALGHRLFQKRLFAQAEACWRRGDQAESCQSLWPTTTLDGRSR
jgi:hypothetical protein